MKSGNPAVKNDNYLTGDFAFPSYDGIAPSDFLFLIPNITK